MVVTRNSTVAEIALNAAAEISVIFTLLPDSLARGTDLARAALHCF
ncbi:MAG: hypothetical protein KDA79_10215 [Planctomycetaceae bacterium]|nr:hypothetical protein [Planctomycetaceae bacterium]